LSDLDREGEGGPCPKTYCGVVAAAAGFFFFGVVVFFFVVSVVVEGVCD